MACLACLVAMSGVSGVLLLLSAGWAQTKHDLDRQKSRRLLLRLPIPNLPAPHPHFHSIPFEKRSRRRQNASVHTLKSQPTVALWPKRMRRRGMATGERLLKSLYSTLHTRRRRRLVHNCMLLLLATALS